MNYFFRKDKAKLVGNFVRSLSLLFVRRSYFALYYREEFSFITFHISLPFKTVPGSELGTNNYSATTVTGVT